MPQNTVIGMMKVLLFKIGNFGNFLNVQQYREQTNYNPTVCEIACSLYITVNIS